MAVEIKMPQLSDTMDSGKILSWSKQEGDSIERGDILAEVETDKANLEIESFYSGVLLKIVTPATETADVGQIIAFLGEAGEAVPDTSTSSTASPTNGAAASAPQVEESQPAAVTQATPTPQTPNPQGAAPVATGGRVKASPLAKKLAKERGVEIGGLSGSGPDGRIVKRDIEAAATGSNGATGSSAAQAATSPAAPQPATTTPQPALPPPPAGDGSVIPFSKMRATIAKRMQQSVAEAPHFFVTTSIRMDALMALRKTLKVTPGYERVSVNHFVIKAAAYGITAEPRVNFTVRDDQAVYQPPEINIGVITAIEDGLLIPVVRNADKMSLQDIAFEARAAVDRARAGRPSAQDLVGGTFSISNMGMFDVESFTAIINPGQGSVLAVSSIKEQPVVENGQLAIGKVMKVTISVDHRIIDGVMAGNFLKAFKESLENPALLFI